MRYFILTILLLTLLGNQSCTESKEVITDYENVVIDGNTVPISRSYSRVEVENYVNRLYIDLWGELPSNTENQVNQLLNDSISIEARISLIQEIVDADRFFEFQGEQDFAQYLNGVGLYSIEEQMQLYTALEQDSYNRGNYTEYYFFREGRIQLENLYNSNSLWSKGEITTAEYYGILSYNPIYDEINMGSENFLVSLFENFLGRAPTQKEKEQGVLIVDSQSGIILNQDGNSKPDAIRIVTESEECKQQIIRSVFQRLLGSSIDPILLNSYLEEIDTELNLKALFTKITSSDEYAFN